MEILPSISSIELSDRFATVKITSIIAKKVKKNPLQDLCAEVILQSI